MLKGTPVPSGESLNPLITCSGGRTDSRGLILGFKLMQ